MLNQVGKFFTCQCPRCSDPSELGTFSSALWCLKCAKGKKDKGKVLPSDTKNIEAAWRCDVCGAETQCQTVQRIFDSEC